MSPAEPIVVVRGLRRVFDVSPPWLSRLIDREPRRLLKAVDGLDFTIVRGETLGLVGESGSGKSTLARMAVGLLKPSAGQVLIEGVDLAASGDRSARRAVRRRMQMIFQDPFASLNPRWRVGEIIAEPIHAFGSGQPAGRGGAGRRTLEPGRPASRRRAKISARVLGRPAPAHRDRARDRVEPGFHRLRRADLGARRLDPGADPQPDARPAG